MLANLKMLLKLRAWIRSGQLKAGGLVVILGAAQTWLQSADGMGVLEKVAALVHLMPSTVSGLALGVVGLAMLIYRAKTEWSLTEKVTGTDQRPPQ